MTVSTLFFFIRNSRPLACLATIFRFALLDGGPVQLARVDAFDAEFLGVFQVVPEFGIEQQGLGRDAAHVQAGAAEHVVFFDKAVFSPYWPARMAAVYPAGPLPMMAMS